MRGREFITLVGGVAAWPLVARAQQSLPLIGYMTSRSSKDSEPHTAAFLRGLGEAGYVPGQNVRIEYRWADGHYERLPDIAAELAKLPLAALVAAGGEPSAIAAKSATALVPIIFLIGGDPVRAGLTASLNRPGANATGISFVTAELGGKRVNLIAELVPNAATIALLVNPKMAETGAHIQSARAGADALGRRLLVLHASISAELAPELDSIVKDGAGALVVQNDPFFDSQRDRLIALAAQYSVPAIYHIREYPAAGGLMSYGASLLDTYRQVGAMTGQVLKGEHLQDIPVLQPTRFELVINLKTAIGSEILTGSISLRLHKCIGRIKAPALDCGNPAEREVTMFDLDTFIGDYRAALAADPSHRSVREVVARAVSDASAVLTGLGEPKRATVQKLYHSNDLTILNVIWAPRMTIMPHNHQMWAVIGIYIGREDNIFWRRLPGAEGGKLEAAGAKALCEKDAEPLGNNIIHSVTNPIGRLTGAIHVYGGDFFGAERSEWDPETLKEGRYDVEKNMRLFDEANAIYRTR